MNNLIICALAIASVLFPMCNINKLPEPDAPRDVVSVIAQCDLACGRMEELKCEGWQGSPGYDGEYGTGDDVACREVCSTIDVNPESDLNPSCIALATSCKAVDRCYR